MKLTLDLHPIFNNQREIDRALRSVIFAAVRSKADLVEIIPGKGGGKLKLRVLAFLGQPHIKRMYDTVQTDPGNSGVVFVHFRHR